MTYRTLIKTGAFLIAATIVTLTACKKKDDTTTPVTTSTLTNADDNGGYASDGAKLEQNNNDVISIADNVATTYTGTSGTASNLRTTTVYPTFTRTLGVGDTVLTIDFGPTDHLCGDGRTRRGEIIVTYSGRYKDSGSIHTITTSGYYVDGYQVLAHKTVTNEGTNTMGQVWYTVVVSDSIVLGTDSVISWTGNRTRTWDAGYSSTDRSDDVYLIGGTTTLTRANGHVFTFAISASDPLKVAIACTWIEAGTVTVSSTSFTGGDRTLNYTYSTTTPGGCDDQAQLTIGARTYDIVLR